MFLMKIWTKIDFRERISIFQSHPSTQNIQNMAVKNMALIWWPEIQKYIDPFCIFLVPVRTIWHDPSIELDLSCSEHFFWLHCDHFSVPNDHFCFSIFVISSIKSCPILTRLGRLMPMGTKGDEMRRAENETAHNRRRVKLINYKEGSGRILWKKMI